MEIIFRDGNKALCEGVCIDKVRLSEKRTAEIRFGFEFNPEKGNFPIITSGTIRDEFGSVAEFSSISNARTIYIIDKTYKDAVNVILKDTLDALKENLLKKEETESIEEEEK